MMSGTGLGTVILIAISCWPASGQEPGLFQPGDAAFAKGDYDAARRSFQKALQLAREPAARYDVLKRLTSSSAAAGQFAEAQRYLQLAIASPNDPKLPDDLLFSVALDMRMKAFDRALATAHRVQAMHVATYGSASLVAADDLLRIGQIYLAQEKSHDAWHTLLDAQGTRTRLNGPLDPRLLPILDELNNALTAITGHGDEAIYRQALAVREMLYGKTSSELISTVEGLANIYSSQGMLLAAEPLYLRLLALWENAVGKDHPMVAVTLDKLVVFYAKAGEPEKARDALARSVAVRAHFLAVGLSLQAQDAISENRGEQAKALYNRALVAMGPPGAENEESIAGIRKALEKIP
jgi:tetratricopeptide (TPR) repeat protein